MNAKGIIFCVLMLIATAAFCSDQESILGVWKTEGGEAEVEIFMCGDQLCGKIVRLQNIIHIGNEEIRSPVLDLKNPDQALRGRQLIGLQILSGFRAEGENSWGGGICYDPKTGNTYRGKLYLVSPTRLVLRGYVGIPFFGRSNIWTR